MSSKYCLTCNGQFYKKITDSKKAWREQCKYCSRECQWESMRGTIGHRLGKKNPNPDYEHPNWKGDKATYISIHLWVARKKGKPQECEFCGTTENRRYHWANVSGDYLRDLNDYIRLCVSCHKNFDRQKGYGSLARYKERIGS